MVDQFAVGRRFTPTTARVDPGRMRQFLKAIGDTNPIFRDPETARTAGLAGPVLPPTYLFCLEMLEAEIPVEFVEALGIDIGRILHGEQSFSYHAPVVVGDTLTFEPCVKSVIDKKGGALTFLVLETRVTNQAGIHVADATNTIVVRN